MTEKLYGCKLLEPDGKDLYDPRTRRLYRYGWQDVSDGVYVAITDGADEDGVPLNAVIRWFECDPESVIDPDEMSFTGVRCFRRVRMLKRKPKGVLPLAVRRGRTIIVQGWYPNGQQMYRCEYCNGQLHGIVEAWLENGSPISRWQYRDGRVHGTAELWHQNGQQAYRWEYRDGERIA